MESAPAPAVSWLPPRAACPVLLALLHVMPAPRAATAPSPLHLLCPAVQGGRHPAFRRELAHLRAVRSRRPHARGGTQQGRENEGGGSQGAQAGGLVCSAKDKVQPAISFLPPLPLVHAPLVARLEQEEQTAAGTDAGHSQLTLPSRFLSLLPQQALAARREREEQVSQAQMAAALTGGASWGFGDDAFEEDEDCETAAVVHVVLTGGHRAAKGRA